MAFDRRTAHLFSNGRSAAWLAAVLLASTACHRDAPATASVRDAGPPLPPITPSSVPVHATPVPLENVEAVVNPGKLPPYTGPTGSIEGIIRVDGPPAPEQFDTDYSFCPDARQFYGKRFRDGTPGPDGSRPVGDAIVTVTNYQGFIPERRDAVRVTIHGCSYDQRTVALTFGQRLEVANDSPGFWAPTLIGAPMPALMVATPHGDPVKIYPPKPGRFDLADQMRHTYAHTDVYVLLQPLHDVSTLDGHYRIDGVPVGKVWVAARVPAIGDQASSEIEVKANEVAKADLLVHYKARTDGPQFSSAPLDGGPHASVPPPR